MPDQQTKVDYINRQEIIDAISAEFSIYDRNYNYTKAVMRKEVDILVKSMLDYQQKGNPLYRSQQIASEANWLLYYTSDWNRLQRLLHGLRSSLSDSQRDAIDQTILAPDDDGSFGAGGTEWFERLDATTDAVQRDGYRPTPLKFIAPILSPGRLMAYLHGLLVSDVAKTGINHRGELASIESSLTQFLTKPQMRKLLADPSLWKAGDDVELNLVRLTDTLADFIDQSQHPRTGYWGPWYILQDELIKMHDLSFTFHIVNYRKGMVDRWDRIIDTTIEIGDLGLDYPYGWKPSRHKSRYSNHHNTDIVKLFSHGFNKVGQSQKDRISKTIFDMLDWCLTKSLGSDSAGNDLSDFVEIDEFSTIERYAFGVSFLDLAGYWSINAPFWWNPMQQRLVTWPDAKLVAPALLKAVLRLNVQSPHVDDIKRTLAPLAPTLIS